MCFTLSTALTKLKTIWKRQEHCTQFQNRTDAFLSQFNLPVRLWDMHPCSRVREKDTSYTEIRCFRRVLGIYYRDHVTNEEVRNRIRQAIGPYEDLLTTVKKRNLRWYGDITRSKGLCLAVWIPWLNLTTCRNKWMVIRNDPVTVKHTKWIFTDVGNVMMAFILATYFDFIAYMSKMAFLWKLFFTPMAFLEYDLFYSVRILYLFYSVRILYLFYSVRILYLFYSVMIQYLLYSVRILYLFYSGMILYLFYLTRTCIYYHFVWILYLLLLCEDIVSIFFSVRKVCLFILCGDTVSLLCREDTVSVLQRDDIVSVLCREDTVSVSQREDTVSVLHCEDTVSVLRCEDTVSVLRCEDTVSVSCSEDTISFIHCKVCLFVGCLTSQQHASVSQRRISSDNCTCCHTEIEVADQIFHLTQSQYTDTGPASPSTDPLTTGAWQGSHWSANFWGGRGS